MATDRLLINYLPHFLREYIEMERIMSAQQPEFDDLWLACENALSDVFILYATENGVKRWESMMGITPKDTDTLDERKFRILAHMNQDLPYTMRKLEEALTTICGAGNFSVDLQHEKYHIEVKLALSNANNFQDVVDLLTKMLPANLTQNVQIMYNTHAVIGQLTHADLSAYTHEQLRSEVFTNA